MPPKNPAAKKSSAKKISEQKVNPESKPVQITEPTGSVMENTAPAGGKIGHSIYLRILWLVLAVVIVPFLILFGFTYWIAKTSVNSQVSDTLSRGLETFNFFSQEAVEQVLASGSAIVTDQNVAAALAGRDAATLKDFFNKQKGDRAWVDIWLALDPQGNIISDLSGSTTAGEAFSHPAIVQKALQKKDIFVSIETVNPDEWPSVFGNWTSQNWNDQSGWPQGTENSANSNTAADPSSNWSQGAVNGNANANSSLSNTNLWVNDNANSTQGEPWLGALENQQNNNSGNANSWNTAATGWNNNNNSGGNTNIANTNAAQWPDATQDWSIGPKEKMVRYIVVPVYSADRHQGTIVIGSTLNNDPWLSERIGKAFDATMGIAYRDTIVATNLKTADGKTAVGQKIPQEVWETVLLNKKYSGPGILSGTLYRLGADPINDASGKPIGLNFVAIPEAKAGVIGRNLSSGLLVVFGFALVLAAALALLVAKNLAKPIKILSEAAHKIGAGDFNAAIDIKGDDEIAQLGKDFTQMEKDLKKRTEEAGRFSKEAKEKTKLLDDKEKMLQKREMEI
ncbi:MAG: cache domain-containing protein, partial [Patescibacteria group bacterium]